jgi:hypothetical protein
MTSYNLRSRDRTIQNADQRAENTTTARSQILTSELRKLLLTPRRKEKRSSSANSVRCHSHFSAVSAANPVQLPVQIQTGDSDSDTALPPTIRRSASHSNLRSETDTGEATADLFDLFSSEQTGQLPSTISNLVAGPTVSVDTQNVVGSPAGTLTDSVIKQRSTKQTDTSYKVDLGSQAVTVNAPATQLVGESGPPSESNQSRKRQLDVSDSTSLEVSDDETSSNDSDFDRIRQVISPIRQVEPSAPLCVEKPPTPTHISVLYPTLTFEHSHTDTQSRVTRRQQHSVQLDVEQTDRPHLSTVSQHTSTFIARPTRQIEDEGQSTSRTHTALTAPSHAPSRGQIEQTFNNQYLTSLSAGGVTTTNPQKGISSVHSNLSRSYIGMEQNAHLSDQLIAPTPFANDGKQKAEEFLAHFKKYARIKQIEGQQKIELFSLLLRGEVATWFDTLEREITTDFHRLIDEFKRAYCTNENLIWMDHQKLFSTPQQPNESVTAFVTRIKSQARRLDITPQTLHHSVIAGLRPNIRQFVVSQGGLSDLNTAIDIALKAEATTVSDPMTILLMESVQNQTRLAETQAKQLEELTQKFNALAATNSAVVAASAEQLRTDRSRERSHERRYTSTRSPSRDRSYDSDRRERKPLKQTPQRVQKQNYVRRQAGEKPTVFENRTQASATKTTTCRNCGFNHAQGQCRAKGATCHNCQKLNHFAKMCRSARAQRQ